jgi:hypothetical protein
MSKNDLAVNCQAISLSDIGKRWFSWLCHLTIRVVGEFKPSNDYSCYRECDCYSFWQITFVFFQPFPFYAPPSPCNLMWYLGFLSMLKNLFLKSSKLRAPSQMFGLLAASWRDDYVTQKDVGKSWQTRVRSLFKNYNRCYVAFLSKKVIVTALIAELVLQLEDSSIRAYTNLFCLLILPDMPNYVGNVNVDFSRSKTGIYRDWVSVPILSTKTNSPVNLLSSMNFLLDLSVWLI